MITRYYQQTACLVLLEGWMQRGVISSEAASEMTPEDTTPQQWHCFHYRAGIQVKADSRYWYSQGRNSSVHKFQEIHKFQECPQTPLLSTDTSSVHHPGSSHLPHAVLSAWVTLTLFDLWTAANMGHDSRVDTALHTYCTLHCTAHYTLHCTAHPLHTAH